MTDETKDNVHIDGIVAVRDFQPYVRLHVPGGMVAQLTMAEARKIAADLVQMCARTEADAMIHRFFAKQGFPPGAGAALMMEFREFRLALDSEPVEGSHSDSETGGPV